ncbi:MAG: hypothetical protein Athens041674_951, partial [Parcubacteria group bacterium Athens0416_74]
LKISVDHLLDKGVGKMNEDAIFIGDTKFGVFDGASSLDGYIDEEGRTGGYLAANIAKETFAGSNTDIVTTALEANRKIGNAMTAKSIDISRKESTWCSTMAVVDIDATNKRFEWAQIADALILVIKKDGTHQVLIRDDYDHDRDIMILWKEMADNRIDEIRLKLQNHLVELRRTANVKYGVLNGDPNAANFLRKGSESLEGVAHILLFTDGMIPPKTDPTALDDFSELVKWYLEGGLSNVRNHIREIEESDPNCWRYPRFKKSDDIGAIAINFE